MMVPTSCGERLRSPLPHETVQLGLDRFRRFVVAGLQSAQRSFQHADETGCGLVGQPSASALGKKPLRKRGRFRPGLATEETDKGGIVAVEGLLEPTLPQAEGVGAHANRPRGLLKREPQLAASAVELCGKRIVFHA